MVSSKEEEILVCKVPIKISADEERRRQTKGQMKEKQKESFGK